MTEKEPEYQDRVKCKNNEYSGIVIAKYMFEGISYLDIRIDDDTICYQTKTKNWKTLETEVESYG